MISFQKIWTACVMINIAILLVNFAGVFPEQWNPYLAGISNTMHSLQEQLTNVSKINTNNLLISMGSWGYVMFLGVMLALKVILLAPVYTAVTMNNLLSSFGVPFPIGYAFTIVSYMSFMLWVVDVFRGRSLNG